MGFYSIYRIIKDCIYSFFGKKGYKLFIIALIIIFLFFFYTKCFATSSIVVDGVTFNFNSQWDANSTYPVDKFTIIRYSYDSTRYSYFACKTTYPVYLVTTGGWTYAYSRQSSNSSNTNLYSLTQTVNKTSTTVNYPLANGGTSGMIQQTFTTSSIDIIYSDTDVYLDGTNVYSQYVNPTLGNSTNELENLSFNNFIINSNSYTNEINNNDGTLFMLFYNRSLSNSNNTDGLYPIKEKGFTKGSIYIDTTNSTSTNLIFNYPIFRSGVFFNIGSTYEIRFAYKTYNSDGTWQYNYLGDRYIFTISSNVTQDYINQLNQQTATTTDEENQDNIENAINNQTQSIDNINNTITDSNVDSSSIDLPTDNTTDITQSGVDNIFQTIYNSFTSGTPQNIVFPIPFTNRNITLNPNYIYNSLYNNGASWIITIIQAFWWYIISRFIIKDIMSKIRKIKQGNFDNIQNSNIREDML